MKHKILAALLLLSVSVFFARPEAIFVDDDGSARASEWKSLGGNFRRTGLSEYDGPEVGCVKWQFDANGPVSASVTVSFDERVHIASEDGNVYTLDANGVMLWSYDANSPLLSSPTIGPDNTIYVGSESGKLYAVDVNGNLRWTHTTGSPIYSSPAVSADGEVYVCSQDGILYALGPDGSERWSFEMGGPAALPSATFASPAIGADGTIYIAGLYDPNLYALEPNDGSVKWSCNFEFPVDPGNPNSELKGGLPFASPVIGADGTIYQTLLYDSNLHAIEPNTGTIIWSIDLADPCSGWFEPNYAEDFGNAAGWSEPALGPDGTIYVSFDDPYLRAVDPNGNIKWVVPFGTVGGFTLAVGSNGLVYAASDDGALYVVDANGSGVAQFQTVYLLSFPVIAADNTIIVSGINDDAMLTDYPNSTIWAIKGYGCEDLNRDEIVNFFDFALLAADWLNCTDTDYPCHYDGNELHLLGDIDEDGYVYLTDVEAMSGRWLEDFKWLKPPSPTPSPGQAINPIPVNGATDVDWITALSWKAGIYATSHDVYFGTSSIPPFVCNQTATIFINPVTMAPGITYYWRIDEVNMWDKTTGVVWHFTTREGPLPPPLPP
jgi:outer membrane protein assembly factor BamB